MPTLNESIFSVALSTDAIEGSIDKILQLWIGLRDEIIKGLTIKIDTTQFEQLQKNFTDLAGSFSSTMGTATTAINEALMTVNSNIVKSGEQLHADLSAAGNKSGKAIASAITEAVATAIKTVPAQLVEMASGAESAGITTGQKIAAGIQAGLKKGAEAAPDALKGVEEAAAKMEQIIEDRSELGIQNTLTDWGHRFKNLSIMAQDEFEKIATQKNLVFSRAALVQTDDKGEFQSPLLKGDFTRTLQDAQIAEKKILDVEKERNKVLDDLYDKAKKVTAESEKQAKQGGATAANEHNKALKEQEAQHLKNNKAINDYLGTQKSIGEQALAHLATLAQWYVMYNLVRTVVTEITGAFRSLVSSGVEYTKMQELQQLGLQGILSESYDLVDNQGHQLTGATQLAVLQGESVKQWQQLQGASLAVVGSTADLVQIYSGILPFASRLGKSLAEVQDMTKGAAVASQLLGISFADARSALTALLQGRALTKNRFTGMLGLTKEDVADASTRWDIIMKKLGQFNALADDAQHTFGASMESFKEYAAMVGAAFVGPAMAAFSTWVKQITDGMFGLNEITKKWGANDQFKLFLSQVGEAAKELLEPLMTLNKEMTDQAGGSAAKWLQGIVTLLQPFVVLIEYVVRGTVAIIDFASANKLLIEGITLLVAGLTALSILKNIAGSLNTLVNAGGIAAKVFSVFGIEVLGAAKVTTIATTATIANTEALVAEEVVTKTVTVTTTAAGAAMEALTRGIKLLAASTAIGAVVVAFGFLIAKLIDFIQKGKDARVVADDLARGNTPKALLDNAALKDKQPNKWASNIADAALQDAQSVHDTELDSASLIVAKKKEEHAALIAISDETSKITSKTGQITEADKARLVVLNDQRAAIIKGQNEDQANRDRVASDVAQLAEMRDMAVKKRQDAKRLRQEADTTEKKDLPQTAEGGDVIIAIVATQRAQAQANEDESKALDEQADKLQRVKDWLDKINVAHATNDDFENKPKKVDVEEKDPHPKLFDTTTGELEQQKAIDVQIAAEDKLKRDRHEITEEQFKNNDIIRRKFIIVLERQWYATRLQDLENYQAEVDKFNEKHAKTPEKIIPQEDIDQKRKAIELAMVAGTAKANAAIAGDESADILAKEKFQKLIDTFKAAAIKEGHAIADDVGEHAVDVWKQQIKILEDFAKEHSLDPDQQAQLDLARQNSEDKEGPLRAKTDLQAAMKEDTRIIAERDAEEKLLQKQFDNNTISVNKYAAGMQRVRAEQVQAIQDAQVRLLQDRQRLTTNIDGTAKAPELIDQDKLNANIATFDALNQRLEGMKTRATLVHDAMNSMVTVMSGFTGFLNNFDVMGEKLHFILDTLTGMVSTAQSFIKLMSDLRAFAGIAKQIFAGASGSDSGGGGGNSLGSMISAGSTLAGIGGSAALATPLAGGGMIAAGGVSGATVGGSGIAAGTTLGLSATAWTGVGAAAAVAVYVGIKLYQRAVKKHTEAIEKGMKDITDAVDNGSITLGESQKVLADQRAAQVTEQSKSKAGRKALQNTQAEYDATQAAIVKKQQEAMDSFKAKLVDAQMGSGPFADFGRMLMSLQTESQDFLKNFTVGSKQYADALTLIAQNYQAALQKARDDLQVQMQSNNLEAISQAESVISLLDAREQLWSQLADQQQSLLDLQDQRTQLATDEAKSATDMAKERADNAKQLLDLEKQIADVMKKAADDELTVRQKGVLEAQNTVAESKGHDISQIRDDARTSITGLQDQESQIETETQLEQKITDANKAFAKRTVELDKQDASIRKQIASTEKQIGLNAINLDTAQRIASLEGGIFDIGGDIYSLEQKRGDLEVIQAKARVKGWGEVKALIDNMSDTAAGIKFTPPAGFPNLAITIGDVNVTGVVDNSVTTGSPSSPTPADPPPPGGADGSGYDGDGLNRSLGNLVI